MKKRENKSDPDSILSFTSDLDYVRRFADGLNAEVLKLPFPGNGGLQIEPPNSAQTKQELLRLIQAWFASGPNAEQMWEENPALRELSHMIRGILLPTKSGRALLTPVAGPGRSGRYPGTPFEAALRTFFLFLLNPYNESLGGPCKHCGKYYVKNTKRQKVYCSKRCGLLQTSKSAIKKRRLKFHRNQLATAKRSAKAWAKSKTRKGWKEWVSNDAHVTKHWLTRAVNSGELNEPVKALP